MKSLLLSLFMANMSAVDLLSWHIAIDRPSDWASPTASHHGKHAELGAIVGAPTYLAAYSLCQDRRTSYMTALVAGATIGIGYEVLRGADGSAYTDPVDAAWTTLGALGGAALTDALGTTASISLSPHRGAIALAWSF